MTVAAVVLPPVFPWLTVAVAATLALLFLAWCIESLPE